MASNLIGRQYEKYDNSNDRVEVVRIDGDIAMCRPLFSTLHLGLVQILKSDIKDPTKWTCIKSLT